MANAYLYINILINIKPNMNGLSYTQQRAQYIAQYPPQAGV